MFVACCECVIQRRPRRLPERFMGEKSNRSDCGLLARVWQKKSATHTTGANVRDITKRSKRSQDYWLTSRAD